MSYKQSDFKIGLIGAGKVGASFVYLLKNAGWEISSICSGHYQKALKAGKFIGIERKNIVKDPLQVAATSNLIIIATADDVISEIVKKLLGFSDHISKNIFYYHLSGAYSSEILEPLAKQGGYVAALHPVQSFADLESAPAKFKNCIFTVQGDSLAVSLAKMLVDSIGALDIIELQAEQRALYHACLCMLSNFTVILFSRILSLGQKWLSEPENLLKIYHSLLSGTVENLEKAGVSSIDALTGPLVRADLKTIKSHLQTLAAQDPDLKEIYLAIFKMGLELLEETGRLKEKQVKMLQEVLSKAEDSKI